MVAYWFIIPLLFYDSHIIFILAAGLVGRASGSNQGVLGTNPTGVGLSLTNC